MNQTVYEHTYIPCPYNGGVQCRPEVRHCETCGWNPDVYKARLEKFCRKHHIAYPLPEIKKEEDNERERSEP